MANFLFYIFAAITLICGSLVVLNRNPVNSAMFLVLSIASMAGLFVLLHAFFLGAVQVLVYAGAVMVLFLFVIMLLDLKEEERRRFKLFVAAAGAVAVVAIAAMFLGAFHRTVFFTPDALAEGDTLSLGRRLFTEFALPFEMLSVLLLVAMVGVILLSKKELK
jgi:NADH-quinone oxidoreductase subunit J